MQARHVRVLAGLPRNRRPFQLDWSIDTSMEEKILTQSSLEPLEGLPQWNWGSFKVPSKSNHSLIVRRAPLLHKSLPRICLRLQFLFLFVCSLFSVINQLGFSAGDFAQLVL